MAKKKQVARVGAIVVTTAIIVVVASVLVVGNRPRPISMVNPESRAAAKSAAEGVRADAVIPVADRAAIETSLGVATIHRLRGAEDTDIDGLIELVARILGLRAGAGADADAYASWMAGEEYALDLPEVWRPRMPIAYEHYTGEKMPEGTGDDELFRVLFEGELAHEKGLIHPEALSSRAEGAEIHVARLSSAVDADWIGTFAEAPPKDGWSRMVPVGGAKFWHAPVSLEDVVSREGHAFGAKVFLGLRSVSGHWFFMGIQAYQDPADGLWCLRSISHHGGDVEIPGVTH